MIAEIPYSVVLVIFPNLTAPGNIDQNWCLHNPVSFHFIVIKFSAGFTIIQNEKRVSRLGFGEVSHMQVLRPKERGGNKVWDLLLVPLLGSGTQTRWQQRAGHGDQGHEGRTVWGQRRSEVEPAP